jgi:hypothetical protein
MDLGFINDRVVLSANYQRNRSSNQLLQYQLPISSGFFFVTRNFPATIQNTSWEFSVNSSNLKTKNINWSSSFNLTIPKNKLIDFANLATSSYASTLVIGEPIRITKVFHLLGVDPVSGLYLVADSKGNPTVNPDYSKDNTTIVNTNPKFYGGFQNSISYKGLELDFLFQFVKQLGINYKFNNGSRDPGKFLKGNSNQLETVLNRWRKPGDQADIQRFSTSISSKATSSDAHYSDASYIRLKNVSLSYNLPEKLIRNIKLTNCRIYVQSQNLLTITNYEGFDPENQTLNSLPPLRVITMGLQIGL